MGITRIRILSAILNLPKSAKTSWFVNSNRSATIETSLIHQDIIPFSRLKSRKPPIEIAQMIDQVYNGSDE